MKHAKSILLPVISSAFLLLALDSAAQIVSAPPEENCNTPSNLTVSVVTGDGALIPGAFVLLRSSAVPAGKPFQIELTTDQNGKVTASVPCGRIDIFATARRFDPNARKLIIVEDRRWVSIVLRVDHTPDY